MRKKTEKEPATLLEPAPEPAPVSEPIGPAPQVFHPVAVAPVSPLTLIQDAINKGMDVDKLGKLMDLR